MANRRASGPSAGSGPSAETFTAHVVRRAPTADGTRQWVKVPVGTFTADLSKLDADHAATVRKALEKL